MVPLQNTYQMNLIEEKNLRIEAGVMAVNIALKRLGLIDDDISQREAYRVFGEAKVRSWINAGLVNRVKGEAANSKATFSRIELETIQTLETNRKLK